MPHNVATDCKLLSLKTKQKQTNNTQNPHKSPPKITTKHKPTTTNKKTLTQTNPTAET